VTTPPRIVHIHVPKTAGTALRAAFEEKFKGQLRVFPHWDEAKYLDLNPEDYDFYSGHIGYDTAKRLKGHIVTVLRNPVDRFVSVYYFWRQLYERGIERSLNTQLAAKYSLSEFVRIRDQPGLLEEFHNRCTLQIAYGSALNQRRKLRHDGVSDDEIFRMAVTNLEGFTVVGIQENMEGLSKAISAKLGVELRVKKINVTESRAELVEVGIAARHAMHDWLYMDLELYAHAVRLQQLNSGDIIKIE
jgi:hypothetical protein